MIDNGNLYLLGGNGLIGCYDVKDGRKKWSREAKEFGGRPGGWGYAESVLIYKNMAIFKPGGKNCIVALDKANGETIWQSSGFDAGPEYGSCLPVTFQGQAMIVTGTNRGIFAVDAASGKLLWSNDWSAGNTANCPTPAYADGYVFWANGYGKGGICLKLKMEDGKVTADVAWKTKRNGLPPRRLRHPRRVHLRQPRRRMELPRPEDRQEAVEREGGGQRLALLRRWDAVSVQ